MIDAYVWLELGKLETTAVELNDSLAILLVLGHVGVRARNGGCRVRFLVAVSVNRAYHG